MPDRRQAAWSSGPLAGDEEGPLLPALHGRDLQRRGRARAASRCWLSRAVQPDPSRSTEPEGCIQMDTTMLERLRVEALASNRDSDRAAILDRFRTMLTRLDEMASSEKTPDGTRSKVTALPRDPRRGARPARRFVVPAFVPVERRGRRARPDEFHLESDRRLHPGRTVFPRIAADRAAFSDPRGGLLLGPCRPGDRIRLACLAEAADSGRTGQARRGHASSA